MSNDDMIDTELTVDKVLAITDPGEVDRAVHTPLDRMMINFGNVVAWAFPLLMLAIVSQVFLRGFGHNQAWLDDAQWWIYGFAMLTAFGYAITTSSHVRVDIFHENYSLEKKAKIEVFAVGWLLLPFLGIMLDVLFHYGASSIKAGEGSDSPNGLHNLYLLKATLPVLFTMCILAAYAVMKRNLAVFSPTKLHKARPSRRRYAAALAHPSCTGGALAACHRLTAASRPSARGRCGWSCLLRRPRACRPRWRSRRRRRRPRTPSRRRHSAGRARRS